MKNFYCYMLSNKGRTLLYIGFTKNLAERVNQHIQGKGALFTKRYNVNQLIYFEKFETKKEAKKREKQLKNWHKAWKWNLIKKVNPNLMTINDY
ncbi:MAG: GIY-YIG nuclease family protein [Bacteroidota bacterium]